MLFLRSSQKNIIFLQLKDKFTVRGGRNTAFWSAFINQPLTNSACCTEVPHTVNTHLKIGPIPSRAMFLVCILAHFKVK